MPSLPIYFSASLLHPAGCVLSTLPISSSLSSPATVACLLSVLPHLVTSLAEHRPRPRHLSSLSLSAAVASSSTVDVPCRRGLDAALDKLRRHRSRAPPPLPLPSLNLFPPRFCLLPPPLFPATVSSSPCLRLRPPPNNRRRPLWPLCLSLFAGQHRRPCFLFLRFRRPSSPTATATPSPSTNVNPPFPEFFLLAAVIWSWGSVHSRRERDEREKEQEREAEERERGGRWLVHRGTLGSKGGALLGLPRVGWAWEEGGKGKGSGFL